MTQFLVYLLSLSSLDHWTRVVGGDVWHDNFFSGYNDDLTIDACEFHSLNERKAKMFFKFDKNRVRAP